MSEITRIEVQHLRELNRAKLSVLEADLRERLLRDALAAPGPDRRAAWLEKQERRKLEGRLHQAELRRQEAAHVEAHYRAQATAYVAALGEELDQREETTRHAIAEFVVEWTHKKLSEF